MPDKLPAASVNDATDYAFIAQKVTYPPAPRRPYVTTSVYLSSSGRDGLWTYVLWLEKALVRAIKQIEKLQASESALADDLISCQRALEAAEAKLEAVRAAVATD